MGAKTNLFDLSGKIACVTGASAGIGLHVSEFLVAQGAQVIGVARREEPLMAMREKCDGKFDYVVADLANLASIDEVATHVRSKFGSPDILVNAAGVNTRQKADDVTLEAWQLTLNLNLSTPFFLAKAFLPAMKEKAWGRIVNFASLQSFRAFAGGIAYGSSKGGVAQLTRAMAQDWSPHGINVNAIGPGFFKTELTEAVFNDVELSKRNSDQTCIGRNGEMIDLNGPIQFLCSDASRYVTGQILMVDGGFTAK